MIDVELTQKQIDILKQDMILLKASHDFMLKQQETIERLELQLKSADGVIRALKAKVEALEGRLEKELWSKVKM